MKKIACRNLCILCFFLFVFQNPLQSQPPTISYTTVLSGLNFPIDVVNAGDGSNRLFIVEQPGQVKVWNGTTLTDFINLGAGGASIITYGGERGLLSLAFHPDFDGTSNRYFFVYYTDVNGDPTLSRFQTVVGHPETGDPTSGQVLFSIPHPGQTNHNGGKLNFGPDGNLYLTTGDGGGGNDIPNNAQNPMSLLGKMLRINVNNFGTAPFYTVPADNPYVGDASFDPRIYNLGLRNPFRWSFDRTTGNMWIGDVGQSAKEEIDFRPAGSTGHNNFGWHCYEGYIATPGVTPCTATDYVPPVYDYDNPGGAAVTGGYVYRGPDYPALRGYYFATDVYSGILHFLWPNGSGGFDSTQQAAPGNFVVGFGEDENGALYAVSQNGGLLYRVVATGGTPLPVKLSAFTATQNRGLHLLKWSTASEEKTAFFHIEVSTNGRSFSRVASVAASRNAQGSNYSYENPWNSSATAFYRLAIEDDDGSITYSFIVKLTGRENDLSVYPTLVQNNTIYVHHQGEAFLQLVNATGTIALEKKISDTNGEETVHLPVLSKGVYFVRVINARGVQTARILIE